MPMPLYWLLESAYLLNNVSKNPGSKICKFAIEHFQSTNNLQAF
jgi:hypothetical protein